MQTKVRVVSQTGQHYDAAGVGRRVVSVVSLDGEVGGFTLPVGEAEFGELQVGAEYTISFTLDRSAEDAAVDAPAVATEADVAPTPSQSGVVAPAGSAPTLAGDPLPPVVVPAEPASQSAPAESAVGATEPSASAESGSGDTVTPGA
jgi:hypothetical protein